MRTTILLSTSLLAFTSYAHPLLGLNLDTNSLLGSLGVASPDDPRFHTWSPAGPGDGMFILSSICSSSSSSSKKKKKKTSQFPRLYPSMSTELTNPLQKQSAPPVPALNALANHGFLPHDGKNLDLPTILSGLSAGLNIGPDVSLLLGGVSLVLSRPFQRSFSLADISSHNYPIEHDASISRQDNYFGSAVPLHAPTWSSYLAFFDGQDTMDIPTVTKARYARFNDSLTRDPKLVFGAYQEILSYGEQALYLQAMGQAGQGSAQKAFVRCLFEQEKLPVELGWAPSASPITMPSTTVVMTQLQALSPGPGVEGARISQDTYKDVLIIAVGGLSKLAELTGGLSSLLGF